MWSEHAPQETVDSKMFPRILAIAEDAWTNPARKNYADFHERLQTQYRRLAYLGVDYGLERKAISYQTTFNKEKKAFTINLTPTQAGIELRYAIGDTLTMAESRLYGRPVTISSTATFITQAEMNGRLVGNPIYLSFITDKALDAGISVEEPYSPEYSAGGVKSLVDGIRGTKNFRDGLWQGYKGTDIDAAVDLKKEETISQVGAGFYQSISSYIFMPTSVEFFVSKDGAHFDSVGVVENNVPDKDPDTFIKDFTLSFKPREIRYVKMVAKSIGVCPPWHIGAGAKAWLFIDEIFAN
ncbi:MAG TPA: discoidin domain-containing protein, partial [Candidatus Kryptobacter bacterium]|nr:discoidin domain-containing protein [Candidatus Kryptobacter bacterium]